MRQPLFSIITITYNAEKEIGATLKSVDAQTCKDYEHLIIDGASRDNTVALAKGEANIPSNPLRQVFSEPDKGLYDAMNKGMHRAKGEYLIFLNAGDSFTAIDTLERYASAAGGNVDIIYADTQLVDAHRTLVGPRHLSVPEVLTFKSFAKGMLVCHQAFCVRRAIAPTYDLTYRFSADYEWCLRCIKATTSHRTRNLHCVAIDYLTDGLTDKNRRASLKERYKIMCQYYGIFPTFLRHLSFIPRAIIRRLRH